MSGKTPCTNDMLASRQIRLLKTSLHPLIIYIGTRSSGEVFDGQLSIIRFTSSSEMVSKQSEFGGALRTMAGGTDEMSSKWVSYGLCNGADFVSKELTEFVAHFLTVINVK